MSSLAKYSYIRFVESKRTFICARCIWIVTADEIAQHVRLYHGNTASSTDGPRALEESLRSTWPNALTRSELVSVFRGERDHQGVGPAHFLRNVSQPINLFPVYTDGLRCPALCCERVCESREHMIRHFAARHADGDLPGASLDQFEWEIEIVEYQHLFGPGTQCFAVHSPSLPASEVATLNLSFGHPNLIAMVVRDQTHFTVTTCPDASEGFDAVVLRTLRSLEERHGVGVRCLFFAESAECLASTRSNIEKRHSADSTALADSPEGVFSFLTCQRRFLFAEEADRNDFLLAERISAVVVLCPTRLPDFSVFMREAVHAGKGLWRASVVVICSSQPSPVDDIHMAAFVRASHCRRAVLRQRLFAQHAPTAASCRFGTGSLESDQAACDICLASRSVSCEGADTARGDAHHESSSFLGIEPARFPHDNAPSFSQTMNGADVVEVSKAFHSRVAVLRKTKTRVSRNASATGTACPRVLAGVVSRKARSPLARKTPAALNRVLGGHGGVSLGLERCCAKDL